MENEKTKSPAEGPRQEIGRLYCDLTAAISHLLGLVESKGLEGWQIGFAKQVVRNVETQYFGYPVPAQPSPDAAKMEEIARQIHIAEHHVWCACDIGKSEACANDIEGVAAILRSYFPQISAPPAELAKIACTFFCRPECIPAMTKYFAEALSGERVSGEATQGPEVQDVPESDLKQNWVIIYFAK